MVDTKLSREKLKNWKLSRNRMLFGIGRYNLYFGFRIVEIFDDKMWIVQSRVMREEWNEIFVVAFSVFQL